MARTTSLSFPNLFNVSRNIVGVLEDNVSVVNRTRLLMLSEPTELYNSPTFGVGLKRYLWQYNTDNTKAIIKDRIIAQLREHEPSVDPDGTKFVDGLIYSGSTDSTEITQDHNRLKMTVGLKTVFGDELEVSLNVIK